MPIAATTRRPTFVDAGRLYTLRQFIEDSGVSQTRIGQAARDGIQLSKLRVGKRVWAATLRNLFDFIGPEGEAVANAAFEHLNTFVIDGVNAVHEKLTGRPLTHKKKVVPMFLADEQYVKLTSQGGAQQALVDSYGHLRHREGGGRALSIPADMDALEMLLTHTDRMHRYAAYAAPARNAELLLNDPELKRAVTEKNGNKGYESIVEAVKAEKVGFNPTDSTTRKIAKLNHAAAGAMIAGKLSVMAKQVLDPIIANSYDADGFKHLAAGMNELRQRGPGAVLREMKDFLGQHSGEWNGRYEAGNYVGEVTNGFYRNRSYFRPSTIVEHAAAPLQMSEQLMASLPNYLAAKAAARRQLGLAPNDHGVYADNPEYVKHVVDAWERKTVRGSNSSDGMELNGALRYAKKQPLFGLVTNFQNQASKVYSVFPLAANELQRGNSPRRAGWPRPV